MTQQEYLPINLSYLRELSGGNTDFEREMLLLFTSEVGIDVADLERALELSDIKMICYIGHKLKSSVQLVGFESLVSLLSEIEGVKEKSTLDERDKGNVSLLIRQLKNGFQDIEKILSEG